MVECILKNHSGHALRIAMFRGDDWIDSSEFVGLEIGPLHRAPIVIGRIDAVSVADEHWGWIYLEDLEMNLMFQVYMLLDGAGRFVESAFGVKSGESSRSDPNPAPWPAALTASGNEFLYVQPEAPR